MARKQTATVIRDAIQQPTIEREQHDEMEWEGEGAGLHRKVKAGSQIERYAQLGILGVDKAENRLLLEVGQQYYEHSYRAGMSGNPKIIDLNRVQGSAGDSDGAMISRERMRKADQAVGPTHAACLRAVCVEDWNAGAWAKKRAMSASRQSAATIGQAFLVDALRILAVHWGMR